MGSNICLEADNSIHLERDLLPKEYEKYVKSPSQYLLEKQRKTSSWNAQKEAQYDCLFSEITRHYNPIPYHNLTHGFDVMTALDRFLNEYHIASKLQLTEDENLFLLIAAFAHDNGHQGYSNSFYINSQDSLALRYSNQSPLENMHSANLLESLKVSGVQVPAKTKKMMVELILATDNAYHSEHLQKLKEVTSSLNWTIHKSIDPQFRKDVLGSLIHTADLNPCGKPLSEYLKWNERLYEEFKDQTVQYAKERKLDLKVKTFNFDTKDWECSVAESNLGFLSSMVLPFFKEIKILMPQFAIAEKNTVFIIQYFKAVKDRKDREKKMIKQ